jgi:hypothetical protein
MVAPLELPPGTARYRHENSIISHCNPNLVRLIDAHDAERLPKEEGVSDIKERTTLDITSEPTRIIRCHITVKNIRRRKLQLNLGCAERDNQRHLYGPGPSTSRVECCSDQSPLSPIYTKTRTPDFLKRPIPPIDYQSKGSVIRGINPLTLGRILWP